MADIKLTTVANIPSTSQRVDITVYEDATGDGTADNSATQTIDNGTNTYTLSGFDGRSGNDAWWEADVETTDDTVTATIDSVEIIPPSYIDVPVGVLNISTPNPSVLPQPVTVSVPVSLLTLTTPNPKFQKVLGVPPSTLSVSTPNPSVSPAGAAPINVPVNLLNLSTPDPRIAFNVWAVSGTPIAKQVEERDEYDFLELVFRTPRQKYKNVLEQFNSDSGKFDKKPVTGGRFFAFDTSDTGSANTYSLTPPATQLGVLEGGDYLVDEFDTSITGPNNDQRRTRIRFVPDQNRDYGSNFLTESRKNREWLFSFNNGQFSTRNIDGNRVSDGGQNGGIETKEVTLMLEYEECEVLFENVSHLAGSMKDEKEPSGISILEPENGANRIVDNTSVNRNTVSVTAPDPSEFSGSVNPTEVLDSGNWIVTEWTATWNGGFYEVDMTLNR